MRNVAALILAAGGSRRLGRPKQFLQFQGVSLIHRVISSARDARCSPLIVVAGEAFGELSEELKEVALLENREWERGIGTSIRRGIEYLSRESKSDAVVLLACDQPHVTPATIVELIEEHERSGKPIVASSYSNTLGIPALFTSSYFDLLLALPDASGAKALIAATGSNVAAVPFAAGAIDIDTPADYEALNRRSQS